LTRLAFAVQFQQRCIRVEITHQDATYTLLEGSDLEISHHGQPLTVTGHSPCRAAVPAAPQLPEPRQAAGRVPPRRTWAADHQHGAEDPSRAH